MKPTRPMRVARASVFAAACLGVSAAGHTWMSGRPVPAAALAAGFPLVFGLALAAAGRPRRFPSIAALMLAGEAGLHVLFSAVQRADAFTSAMSVPAMPNMPGMPMPAGPHPTAPVTAGAATMAAMGATARFGTPGMLGVHVGAGLACAWWLYRGERAFFTLLAWILEQAAASLLPSATPDAGPGPVPSPPGPPPHVSTRLAYPELLAHILVRRGPPEPRTVG